MSNKLFNPNDNKTLFTITIQVKENCATLSCNTPKGQDEPTYHEVIGALETQKQHLIWSQREHNMKKLKKK